MGRPTKYKLEYCDEIIEYFGRPPYVTDGDGKLFPNDLPLFVGFAKKIGVNVDTLNEWTKVHPEFSESYKKAKDLQESCLVTNALRGLYNSTFAIFTAKNILNWRDKNETEHTGSINHEHTVQLDAGPNPYKK